MAQDVSVVEVGARLLSSLLVILAMIGGGVLVLRRRRATPGARRLGAALGLGRGGPRLLEVLERQSITRSTSMALVRVGGRSFLVGATDANVSVLADVSEQVEEAELEAALEAEAREADRGPGGLPAEWDGLRATGVQLFGSVAERFGLRR